jgi:flagellin
MIGINSNINSLVAQQNLTGSGSALAQAITRLSSGKRINSAADDAAGLAISNIMQTQINGLNQGVSNANDGVSMVQTASSGLSSLTNSLQRIRELATQAANGSMTDDDRAALQQEVNQQVSEINRIASQTTYNGMNVLNGTMGSVSFQVGANVGQNISLDLSQNMGAAALGAGGVPQAGNTLGSYTNLSLDSTGNPVDPFAGDKISVTDDGKGNVTATDSLGNSYTFDSTGSTWSGKDSKGAALTIPSEVTTALTTAKSATNATAAVAPTSATKTDSVGVTDASVYNGARFSVTDDGSGNITASMASGPVGYASDTFTYDSTSGTWTGNSSNAGALNAADISDLDALRTQASAAAAGTPAVASTSTASVPGTTTAAITQINVLSDGKGGFTYTDQNNQALNADAMTTLGLTSSTLPPNGTMTDATGASEDSVTAQINTLNAPSAVSDIDISTKTGASMAMESIDNALSAVDNLQATLGAAQNRFTAIGATQQAQSTDLSTAQSSIQDADFAQETANLSKAQVLQQAGISVLAQANSQPQQVLKLLQ